MRVVGERHHDVRTGAKDLAVQLAHCLGEIESDLGDIGPGLDVAAPLQLKDVPFGAQHDAGLQSFENPATRPNRYGWSQSVAERSGRYPRPLCHRGPVPTASGR